MCNCYSTAAAAFKHLIASKDGVVSFVYVFVAAAIIDAMAVFGTSAGTGPIKDTLTSAMNTFKDLGRRSLRGRLPPTHWCLRPASEACT